MALLSQKTQQKQWLRPSGDVATVQVGPSSLRPIPQRNQRIPPRARGWVITVAQWAKVTPAARGVVPRAPEFPEKKRQVSYLEKCGVQVGLERLSKEELIDTNPREG